LLTLTSIRVIAPDLVGFGLSSKLDDVNLLGSLDFHISYLVKFTEVLQIKDFTIVGQDWGGPMVAGIAARLPHLVNAAVFANTGNLTTAIVL
jgi:haloalkane dehalogenase